MAPNTTPSNRKRARDEDEDHEQHDGITNGSPSARITASVKKRRLHITDSPSTPKTLNAIATAISGALGPRQPAQDGDDAVMAYDVPDSDEDKGEASKSRSRRRGSSGQKSSAERSGRNGASASAGAANLYDVPDSDDDLDATVVASPSKRSAGKDTKARASAQRSAARSSRRVLDESEDGENGVAARSSAVDDSPSKPRSTRRSLPAAAASEVNGKHTSPEAPEDQSTPRKATALTPSGRKKRDPLAELVIDGTPILKGILTPSRRDKAAGDRPQKSVAFEQGSKEKKKSEEVFFADLPGKKTGRSPRSPAAKAQAKTAAKASPKPRAKKNEAAAVEDAAKKTEDKEEDEEDDDTPCAICGDPDSRPSNDIIFCDHCDMAVHQKCYNVPVIPEGDWLCKTCSQEEDITPEVPTQLGQAVDGKAIAAAENEAVDIANFETHLRSFQRVLLDRCTGRRRIRLRGQDDAYDKTYQLVEQTVLAGEGNSMMIIGARGSGKTTMVESVMSSLAGSHKEEFHVIRLNGFIHTDDKLALKEIWRQLGKEMEVEDDLVNKTNNYADTLASLLALLSHPSEMSNAEEGTTSKSVVFVIDEFDLFAAHARQTLLYNLFDIAQARKAPIAVLGLTTRIDVVESLEKRVKSRFSHRYVYLGLPKSLPAYWDVVRHGLRIDDDDLATEGIDTTLEGHAAFLTWWNNKIDTLRKDQAFQDHLEFHFYSSKSAPSFLTTCILPLSSLTPASHALRIPGTAGPASAALSLDPPDSSLHLLESLSDLDLSLLIAAARLDVVAHTDTVNFAMAYDEYSSLVGRQRAQSAGAGMLAGIGGGVRVWGRGVAGMAWERLAGLGLLIPAGGRGGGAGAGTGQGGLEAKMWKVDVALEEIPAAVRLSAVLARWCREI